MTFRPETLILLGAAALSACSPKDLPQTALHYSAETPISEELEPPITICFYGSSTIKEMEKNVYDYLESLFPGPKYRLILDGFPGFEVENLNEKAALVNICGTAPDQSGASKIDYLFIYGGANDLFNGDSRETLTAETVDLFANLTNKFPSAKFIYLKPYHLHGIYADKNKAIDDFDNHFSPTDIANEVRLRTRKTISLTVIDINAEIDSCQGETCWTDDRHAGPTILKVIGDKTRNIIP